MHILCLDLEGVLIPEIWIEFAKRTGIAELSRTTRDEPDYDKLMRARLDLLRRHRLGLPDIQRVIHDMGPLSGANDFLAAMRSQFQVVILSDTFSQFAQPLMRQLGWPTLFCHELDIGPDGMVRDYRLRMTDHKRAAVRAFKALNFKTIAAGDSYNDVAMLGEADAGIFVHPPANVAAEFPQFPVTRSYDELAAAILKAAASHLA
ncbi:MAG: bifunctional phosphoserine phosphatase/homoserine phosphotransferase ThrH [Betaproteobacteria bacterium]|nr:MAG: bifunctional phosphoserine phosphatase/homoserine phosphotransferase ThrH [Betaproteobacteria bacterium]